MNIADQNNQADLLWSPPFFCVQATTMFQVHSSTAWGARVQLPLFVTITSAPLAHPPVSPCPNTCPPRGKVRTLTDRGKLSGPRATISCNAIRRGKLIIAICSRYIRPMPWLDRPGGEPVQVRLDGALQNTHVYPLYVHKGNTEGPLTLRIILVCRGHSGKQTQAQWQESTVTQTLSAVNPTGRTAPSCWWIDGDSSEAEGVGYEMNGTTQQKKYCIICEDI